MRWIFADVSEREDTLAGIDAFWSAFESDRERIAAVFSRESDLDLPGWMRRWLAAVHPEIMWEFGPAVDAPGHRLVMTSEGAHELRPLVDTVVERAPSIEGWQFHGFRLPEPAAQMAAHVQARTGLDFTDAKVAVTVEEHGLLGLRLFVPSLGWAPQDQIFGAAMVATETLLGEETLDRWIGPVDVAAMPKAKRSWGFFGKGKPAPVNDDLLPLAELRPRVEALVAQVLEGRPAAPLHETAEDAEWTMFRLEPSDAPDYPGQHDLMVARTMTPAVWAAAHSHFNFMSDRYSAHGERFVYVKLDDAEMDPSRRVEIKGTREDALTEALEAEGLGCVVGGGSGLRYSYIDLALMEADRALPLVRERLRALDVPHRAWILFHDAYLAGEWLGIHDGAPPPPMALD